MRRSFRVLVSVLSVALASYVTVYTVVAYQIAFSYAGGFVARSGSWGGMGSIADPTFFPWPRGYVGLYYPFPSAMNPVDKFIYLYLLQIPTLIFICLLSWIIVAHYIRVFWLSKLIARTKRSWNSYPEPNNYGMPQGSIGRAVKKAHKTSGGNMARVTAMTLPPTWNNVTQALNEFQRVITLRKGVQYDRVRGMQ